MFAPGDHAAALLQNTGVKSNVIRSSIWPSSTIQLHWKNPEAVSDEQRGWVRDVMAHTWEGHRGLKFVGWTKQHQRQEELKSELRRKGHVVKG